MSVIVHWFRRDLRVEDNTSLFRAARDADGVLPVFVLDDHYAEDPNVGPARLRFLRESLEQLERSLADLGSRLVVRPGPASVALPALVAEVGASAVYANLEIGPHPEKRDREARDALEAIGSRLVLFPDALLVEPDVTVAESGKPYTVYGAYLRSWMSAEKSAVLPAPDRLEGPSAPGVLLDRVAAWSNLGPDPESLPGGEVEANEALAAFVCGPLETYAADRDFPGRDGTSRLSPHLHFGTISPRTILAAVSGSRVRDGARKFVSELAWREFFHHLLFHFPHVATESFRPEFREFPWSTDEGAFSAWRAGLTGYPLVDAGMRQLARSHWMHNRARMAVAFFLTKDLHLDWRLGEKWFEHELTDADLASNNGGWQWVAGTGADAVPYFRILNPVLQSKRFDPDGAYIRRFVPELARVRRERIHEPWTMTTSEQREAGCQIGVDYPAPIVDHAREREAALRMFEVGRKRK
jgi:deoxyribodipyrimidine photo-lyase